MFYDISRIIIGALCGLLGLYGYHIIRRGTSESRKELKQNGVILLLVSALILVVVVLNPTPIFDLLIDPRSGT